MFQQAATSNRATDSSRKCLHCGLRNFAHTNQCMRCKSDFALQLNVKKSDKQMVRNSGKFDRSTFSFAWILAALVVVSLGLVLFYLSQGPRPGPDVAGEAVVAQTPVIPAAEQSAQNVEQGSQSDAAATQILTSLEHFQDATDRDMDYDEYDRQLNGLKTELNNTLPTFVRHDPGDEIFRQEVAAALRDYTAARNWWKTTITNSTVFTEADRTERTQRNFESARTHLTNAEKTWFAKPFGQQFRPLLQI
jgi:hypothetical protein